MGYKGNIINYSFITGTFVPKSTIIDENINESTEGIVQVEPKSTSSNEPPKLHPEPESPTIKTFKRLSAKIQESPTLESFGLSDHALALLKAG